MKATVFLILILQFFGCKKVNSFCGYRDPVNELEWLNNFVNNPAIIHCDVYEAIYKDTSGFYLKIYTDSAKQNVGGASFTNCEGIGQCSWGGIMPPNCPNYSQYETHRKLIYSR